MFMTVTGFDTYDFVESLRNSGMPKNQAVEVAKAMKKIANDNLATKTDLENLKIDILKWIIPLILGQYALIITILLN